MAKTVAKLIGVVFILVGIVGFIQPNLLGAHLGKAHNAIHLVSGAISLYFGLKGSLASARQFCIIFGLAYGLLGVVGYFVGVGPHHMIELPKLVLGTVDHAIHIAIGALYLIGGFTTKSA
jgi:preprotein translocase subunit Sss1